MIKLSSLGGLHMNQGTFPSQKWRPVERTVDERSLLFPGDVDDNGRPLPMTVEILAARAKRWPQSAETPANISGLLARSRELFVDSYYTYENFLDAAVRSLRRIVHCGCRVRLRS